VKSKGRKEREDGKGRKDWKKVINAWKFGR
jgi:hypothetical protein